MEIFTTDINVLLGKERRQEDHTEATLDVPSLSTTSPGDGLPTTSSIDEPVRIEELTSKDAGSHAMATDVSGGEEVTPQQTHTGNPLAFEHLSFLHCFCFLELDLNLVYNSSIFKSAPTDHMNNDIDVEGVAKDVAAEANGITADKTARTAQEEAAKKTTEEVSNDTSGPTDDIPAARALGATPATVISYWQVVAEDEPSTYKDPSKSKYLKVGDKLYLCIPGMTCIGVPVEG